MVAPGFLQNGEVRRWLNGVEPAWTMLDFDSFNALRIEPSADNRTIRLETNLSQMDLSGSAVLRTASLLLQRAADAGGLALTATGNLSRSVVAEMIDIVEWPGLDKDELFQFNKVINEPDFLPLYFVRVLAEATKLVRARRGKLGLSRPGKSMLVPERYGALQALLFHIAFWHLNLSYFDRSTIESWPQGDVGVVLWSLSASANEWLDRGRLTRLCTVPVIGVLESVWDVGSYAMEARILRPLVWFGLLEQKSVKSTGPVDRHLYRKTPLFDRLVHFHVRIERPATRH
jgi:hypothetical protein